MATDEKRACIVHTYPTSTNQNPRSSMSHFQFPTRLTGSEAVRCCSQEEGPFEFAGPRACCPLLVDIAMHDDYALSNYSWLPIPAGLAPLSGCLLVD